MSAIKTGLPTPYQEQIHMTKYSRWRDADGRREFWSETTDRYLDLAIVKRAEECGYHLPPELIEELRRAILTLEVGGSMRAVATAGPALERDHAAAYNCSYLTISRPQAFDETLYLLSCGVGVGFSVERQYVKQLPEVPDVLYPSDTTIVVPDSKIGWASSLRQLIHLLYSGVVPQIDVSKVRPAGAPLRTFGGRASGPGPFLDLCRYTIATFREAVGRKLYSIECHGIQCKIGDIVVAGGPRRAALISLSNPSDDRMRDAKSGEWSKLHPEYANANNSAVWTDKPSMERFIGEWAALIRSKSGERGIVYREGMKKHAAKNGRRDADHEFGTNPCCVDGDTWIMTDQGPARIRDLQSKPFRAVVDGKTYAAPFGSWVSGWSKTLTVRTHRGQTLRLTPEHKLLTEHGWVEACDLELGDQLVIHDHRNLRGWGGEDPDDHGYLLGIFVGDGNFVRSPSSGNALGQVKVWELDKGSEAMAKRAYAAAAKLSHRRDWGGWSGLKGNGYHVMSISHLPTQYGLQMGDKHNITVLENQSSDFCRNFLTGLFDADGSLGARELKTRGRFSITLGQAHLGLLESVQRMLLRLGIKSRIYAGRPTRVAVYSDGSGGTALYEQKQQWRLYVTSDDAYRFADRIGFTHSKKARRLEEGLVGLTRGLYKKPFMARVEEIISNDEKTEVWDAHVDSVHAFDANGIYAHNSEILLRDCEFCNLSEAIVRPSDSFDDLRRKIRLVTILGTIQSTYTDFRYLSSRWKRNCEEERLLGVSLTGIMDHPVMSGRVRPGDYGAFVNGNGPALTTLDNVLESLKEYTVEVNAELAEKLGINPSAAITCVKPSGNRSQLVDCASGIHARHSRFYVRTNRLLKADPVAQFLRESGVPCEDEQFNPDTNWVFSYPIKAPDGAVTREDITAIDHLELWLTYARHWCEHKPSITVSVREDEWLEVGNFVYKNFDEMTGVSFLPYVGHTYQQAPYQEVGQQEYDDLVRKMPTSLDWTHLADFEREDHTESHHELACTADSCEVI